MLVFELDCGGEVETIAATNALQAVLWYLNTTGVSYDNFDPDDEIIEIPKEKWDTIKIGNEDNDEVQTLSEIMKTVKETCLIASTAY